MLGEFARNDFYSTIIGSLKKDLANKRNLTRKRENLLKSLQDSQYEYVHMLDAQKLLSAVSEENTEQTLSFITGMVNKVLSEIFPNSTRRIVLKKKLYAGSKPHINVLLVNGLGDELDLDLQEGDGIKQIISVMYVICLIEIRKGRRLLILDERLNGLHAKAKQVLAEIIKIFAEGGFQFIFVEYSLNNIGKIYNIETRGDASTPVYVEGNYSDDLVYVEDADLSILDKDYVDDTEEAVEEVLE